MLYIKRNDNYFQFINKFVKPIEHMAKKKFNFTNITPIDNKGKLKLKFLTSIYQQLIIIIILQKDKLYQLQ